jgi:hypothetical protein
LARERQNIFIFYCDCGLNPGVKMLQVGYACRMDVNKMLSELREEREHIDVVILSLERLARGQGRRRGRPPAWLKAATAADEPEPTAPKKRGRPPGAKNKPKEDAPG